MIGHGNMGVTIFRGQMMFDYSCDWKRATREVESPQMIKVTNEHWPISIFYTCIVNLIRDG